MASDFDAIVARSYVVARKHLPQNIGFWIYASCTATVLKIGHEDEHEENST